MDDEADEEKERPVTPGKLSKTPSWITLGFILGALCVWLLPRDPAPAPPVNAKPTAPAEPPRVALTTLTMIEAVFEAYGQYAVWDHDLTEVTMWNAGTKSFSEFYEIRRGSGGTLYFRSIPQLTRVVLPRSRHTKPPPDDCPLQFTESEQQNREWREQRRTERSGDVPASDPPPKPAAPAAQIPPKS